MDYVKEIQKDFSKIISKILSIEKNYLNNPLKVEIGTIDNSTIFLVDGDVIKKTIDMDFTEGGSDARYKYIEDNEIYVDSNIDSDDFKYIILHEYVERKLMTEHKLEYDEAHDIANKFEKMFRLQEEGNVSKKLEEEDLDKELNKEQKKEELNRKGSYNYFNIRISFVKHMPGHKNSSGEAAPYVIVSHETGKILSSHKTKEDADSHLKNMHIHKESYSMNFEEILKTAEKEISEKEMEKGIKVEHEHDDTISGLYDELADKDPYKENLDDAAKEIVKDHEDEAPKKDYYEYLDKMEKEMKKESSFIGINTIAKLIK